MAHPTIMLRREVLLKNKILYNSSFRYSMDYELWVRLAELTHLANLPIITLKYRTHQSQITQKHGLEQRFFANLIRINQVKALGLQPSEAEQQLHLRCQKSE